MGIRGLRAGGALMAACISLWASEGWAQTACSTLNGTSVTIPGAGGVNSIDVTYAAGQSVTVTITGATGNGTITFGNGSTNWSGNGTYTVTATVHNSNSTVVRVNNVGAAGGTASFVCNGTSGSNGSSSAVATQTVNNAQVAIGQARNSTQFLQSVLIKNIAATLKDGTTGGKPAGGGAKTCPACTYLRAQLTLLKAQLDNVYVEQDKNDKLIDKQSAYLKN